MARATNESTGAFLKRAWTGTTFLGLEHVLHMLFVVVVAGLLAVGLVHGLYQWFGWGEDISQAPGFSVLYEYKTGTHALMLVSALAVTSLLTVFLDRRVRAEMRKRPGFERRLAYKLPLYGAMGAVALVKISLVISALSVVLYSLATMGQESAESIAGMYRMQFVPALVGLGVFGVFGWHLLRLAQGKVRGRMFNAAVATLGILLAISLFITTMVNLQSNDYRERDLLQPTVEDYLKDYSDDAGICRNLVC